MKISSAGRRERPGRRSGSVAVEFALVGPLLIMMLIGMALYGGWFWLAQGVQSLATESARAAVAGIDETERQVLAEAFIAAEAAGTYGFDADRLEVVVDAEADAIRVTVALDASDHPIMALAALIPAPPGEIERSAVVRMGGF